MSVPPESRRVNMRARVPSDPGQVGLAIEVAGLTDYQLYEQDWLLADLPEPLASYAANRRQLVAEEIERRQRRSAVAS